MLAIVENYLGALGAARSDAELTRILGEAAKGFGFRSAYLIEYAGKFAGAQRVLDTDSNRRGWWGAYFAGDMRPSPRDVAQMLSNGTLQYYDASRFGPGSERLRAALADRDLIDVTAVPVSQEAELAGVVGFCGAPRLDRSEETALQVIAYSAFAHLRAGRRAVNDNREIVLTPREREVMRLTADGLTSIEIAERLGMSARTANQHIDNVADKLGTRNRTHTVAEIVRRGLL
jgi:DNA-binding CsgD family transcriptional regulator